MRYDNFPFPRIRNVTDHCIYCGEVANSIEHFPPQSLTERGYLFSACLECNSIASTHFPTDLVLRANFVKKRLTQKYAKYLKNLPPPSKEQLGPNLTEFVRLWMLNEAKAKRRIAWNAQLASFDTDLGKSFALMPAGKNKIVKKEKLESPSSKKKLQPSEKELKVRTIKGRLKNCRVCKTSLEGHPSQRRKFCSDTCMRQWNNIVEQIKYAEKKLGMR